MLTASLPMELFAGAPMVSPPHPFQVSTTLLRISRKLSVQPLKSTSRSTVLVCYYDRCVVFPDMHSISCRSQTICRATITQPPPNLWSMIRTCDKSFNHIECFEESRTHIIRVFITLRIHYTSENLQVTDEHNTSSRAPSEDLMDVR